MCENTRAGRIPAGRSLDTGPVQAKRRFRSDVKPVGFPAWPWQRGAGKSQVSGGTWNSLQTGSNLSIACPLESYWLYFVNCQFKNGRSTVLMSAWLIPIPIRLC